MKTRIIVEDNGIGSISAWVMPFVNAIMQTRQIAFDGVRWFVQANNRAPFKPVGESEVSDKVKQDMQTFMNKR
jgi:hypothetical protein